MKKNLLFKTLCLPLLLALQVGPARAEDIDLFTGFNPSTTDLPNVLFVVDNTANWNQPFSAEMTALSNAFASLPPDKFRVGLMMFTETGGGNGKGTNASDGGYVRAAIRTLNATSQAKYSALIKSLDVGNDKSNGGKAGATMVEVHRYLSGATPYAGNNKVKTDYTGNTGVGAATDAIYALSGNSLASKSATTYLPPPSSGCAGTYVIYLSNGPVQDNSSDSQAATSALKAAGTNVTLPADLADWTSPIVLSTSGSQDNVADEWARFLHKGMGVKVFTIDVMSKSTGQTPGWTALLQSMAAQSKGDYFDLTQSTNLGQDLADSLNSIFSKIQSVNSAFASVSLPMSVNTQGTYLNQIFVGMFRPDGSALPRWNGNIKQYKLGLSGGNLILQDAAEQNAVSSQTGFVAACTRSFWTPTEKDDYWTFNPSGDCLGEEGSNSRDGNVVEKGAQAYMLRSMAVDQRKVLTCSGTNCSALVNFDANLAAKESEFGVVTKTERDHLIQWTRGKNNSTASADDDLDKKATKVAATAMRPSIHGDVVHSRPVALNYGTDAQPKVVVFYGGNDGMLRAVNGNRSAAFNGVAAGAEFWSFMPPEFYASISRLYNNTVRINYPGLITVGNATVPQAKPYGMDGPVTAYQSKDGKTVWVYAGMRRGGRSIYGFDASDMTSPVLKWRLGCPNAANDTDCSTDMSEIGQTWSAPKVMTASAYGSGTSPLLVFGGGYDKCEDADPAICTSSSKGKRIYVVDADSGKVLKTFPTARGVVGEVTVLKDDAGHAKLAYAADLGGNIYRIDGMASKAPDAWTLTQVASLGCNAVTTCRPNRKFMFGPDVVEENGVNVLLIGSGDREKPLRSYTGALGTANYFYMLVDKPSEPAWLSNEATTNCGSGNALLCHASLLGISGSANPDTAALSTKKGWYLAMAAGEQVVTSSVTAYGTTTFSSHIPTDPGKSQSCKADLGTAHVYNIAYTNAAGLSAGRFQNVEGGGLSPSPVVHRVQLDDGSKRDVVIGANPESPLSPSGRTPQAAFKQPKGRVYWFIQR